jgi:uncharacterized membrane protein
MQGVDGLIGKSSQLNLHIGDSKMFTNRTNLSAFALGTLLSISALQPALAAEDAKADVKMARNFQQYGDAPCAESQKQVIEPANKKNSSPDTWLDSQLLPSNQGG